MSKGSVIVVDDENSVRDVLNRALSKAGYDVTTSLSGKDALKKTAEQKFDLMFLDIMMPEMDGMEVLEKMPAEDRPDAVVFLTAKTDPATKTKALKHNAFEYITKPCKLTEVIEVAERAVSVKEKQH